MHYFYWLIFAFRWEITSRPENLQAIRDYFGERLQEQQAENFEVVSQKKRQTDQKTLLIQPTHEGRLRLIFRYHAPLIDFIKQLPYPVYDANNRWWSVPDTDVIRSDVSGYAEKLGRACEQAGITKKVTLHTLRHTRVGGPICHRSGGPHIC